MSEREDNVYKAKLAEQAERYDGEYIFSGKGPGLRQNETHEIHTKHCYKEKGGSTALVAFLVYDFARYSASFSEKREP